MVELIAKVSKGSRMDQVYIPKNRVGLHVGNYVIIKQLKREIREIKLHFYNSKNIEPIKIRIIKQVFSMIDNNLDCENIIITGSFMDEGFHFNDIDILVITKEKNSVDVLKKLIERGTGIKTHLILINNKDLIRGLSTDPLYQMMLSKCVSKKRLIYKIKPEVNYKLLDLHLLNSKTLIDNFDILEGHEKYHLARNMIAILLFLQKEKVTKDLVDKKIEELLKTNIASIKNNLINKKEFIKNYEKLYEQTFNLVMSSIKNS